MSDVLVLEQRIKCQKQITVDIEKLFTQGKDDLIPASQMIGR